MTAPGFLFDADSRSNALSALLARNWWAVGLRGLFALVFATIALVTPAAAMLSLLLVFAFYMLVDGIFAIVSAVRAARGRGQWGLLLLQGVVSLAAAVAATLLPGVALITFVLLIAAWMMISGVLGVAAAVRLRRDHGRWWMGFGGMLSVITGVVFAAAPLLGALVLTWWIGAYALIYGVTLLMLAFRLRPHRDAEHNLSPHPA
ncbi:MAG: HdeD family acid-resistance protein [Caulobacteraceae bacterium]